MAFLRPLDEQNQQQTQQGQQSVAPSTFGGGQTITPTPGSQAASSQPKTQAQQGGTSSGSWTNIDAYLNANPSFGQKALDKGKDLLGQEKTAFDKSLEPIRNATNNFTYTSIDPEELHSLLGSNQLDTIKNTLNQPGYTGPTSVDYDPNKSENVLNAKKLSNRDLAGEVLARDAVKEGRYGLGLRNLDSSLLGADQNYTSGAKGIWDNVSTFLEGTKPIVSDLSAKASKDKWLADESKKSLRESLGEEKNKYKKEVEDRIGTLKQQQDESKKTYADAYAKWYNEKYRPGKEAQSASVYKGKPYHFTKDDLFGYSSIGNYEAGISPENAGTDEDYRYLSNIANVLGEKPVYTTKGQFKLPTYIQDNGQEQIDAWKYNNPNYYKAWAEPAAGVLPYSQGALDDLVADQILGSGEGIETPEQVYKRLGLS